MVEEREKRGLGLGSGSDEPGRSFEPRAFVEGKIGLGNLEGYVVFESNFLDLPPLIHASLSFVSLSFFLYTTKTVWNSRTFELFQNHILFLYKDEKGELGM